MKNRSYMNDRNYFKLLCFRRISLLRMIAVISAFSCSLFVVSASSASPIVNQAGSPMTEQCKADLAKRLNVHADMINVISAKPATWSDTSLGMPQIGGIYAQMMTPGMVVILKCKNSQYVYTTSTKAFRYGGSTDSWAYSLLFTKPVSNEPNLNGDLYQCSLLGTNSVRVASGVSDYYPSNKGMIIIKRRTSRSGHELLYIKADGKGKVTPLYSAFDFGEAAFNDKQDRWTGFVRKSLGDTWCVVVGHIGKDNTDVQLVTLPESVRPVSIAWSGEKVMIITSKDDQNYCFEISPKSGTPVWKEAGVQGFPGMMDYALNKSESLEISQISKNGNWSVEVARVWFTGDRNLLAAINDFILRGNKLLGGRFAYIWGERDDTPAICTVDIATGEVIPFTGGVNGVKPYLYPLRSSPMGLVKGK